MEFLGTVTPRLDLPGEFLCPAFGVAEDNRKVWVGDIDQPAKYIEFFAFFNLNIRLFDLRDDQIGVLNLDKLGFVHESFGDIDDRLWKGGREEQCLAFLRNFFEDQFDIITESHIKHLISFIKYNR